MTTSTIKANPVNVLAVARGIVSQPQRGAIGASVREIDAMARAMVNLHAVASRAVELLTATEAGDAAAHAVALAEDLERAGYLHFINEEQPRDTAA